MALELDGRQRQELRDALLDGFLAWADLDMMVSDQLGEHLAAIAPESAKLTTVAHELIKWAGARGKLGDLIVAARNANPDNPKLFRIAQRVGLTSTSEPKSTLEKVVGGNTTFLDVAAWRGALTRMEWKVCRIDRDGRGVGTGFLVGPDAVLTNYHVVEPAIEGGTPHGRYSCRFDYKMSEAGDVIASGETVGLAGDDDWLIASSTYSAVDTVPDPKPGEPGADELDFALLRLSGDVGHAAPSGSEMGEPRSWVEMRPDPVDFAAVSTLAILQHPDSAPLKLALGMEQSIVVNAMGNRIRYTIPTLPGSSGSPVFDSEWTLLALHHSGDPTAIKPEYNEAIPIANIATQPAVAEYLEHLADED